MSRYNVGDRVGAISHSKDGVVYLFGFGVYAGKKIPPENAGCFNFGLPNPCIQLDNGKEVFGCECWWGPEEQIKKEIGERQVITIDIDDSRKGILPEVKGDE